MRSNKLLKFNNVYVTLLHPFSLIKNRKEKIIQLLSKLDTDLREDSLALKSFKIVDEFHLSPEYVRKEFLRLELSGFTIESVPSGQEANIPVEVFLSIYPSLAIGVLIFAFKLKECMVDDLIFLEHTLYREKGFKLSIGPFPKFINDQIEHDGASLKSIFRGYRRSIQSEVLTSIPANEPEFFAKCIEIRNVFGETAPEDVLENYPKEIYGCVVSDEGWRFVPEELAKEKLLSRWGSRVFFRAIPHGTGIVVLNFRESEFRKDYVESQITVREKYGQMTEGYFTYDYKIGGLDHGLLQLLEALLIQRFSLELLISKIQRPPRKLKDVSSLRAFIARSIEGLRFIRIPEMGVFGRMLSEAMGLDSIYDYLEKRISEMQQALTLSYTQRINKLIIVLTVTTVILAVISLILTPHETRECLKWLINFILSFSRCRWRW